MGGSNEVAELRTGEFGEYYGTVYTESSSLTKEQQKVNATYIYKFFTNQGWTVNAIAGMIGNMQAESALNPGRWQSEDVGNTSGGYGLVQWTPMYLFRDWCTSAGFDDPSTMDANVNKIEYERQNGQQFYPTDSYDMTFEEFVTSEESAGYLAKAFLLNYERPADQSTSVQNLRASYAEAWYEFLTSGELPDIDDGGGGSEGGGSEGGSEGGSSGIISSGKKRGFKFHLYTQRRMKQWINKRL